MTRPLRSTTITAASSLLRSGIIDNTWAEPFEIHPWTTEGYAGRGGPDSSRAALIGPNVVGVYTTPGSKVMGETADSPASQIVENEVWLAVEQTVLIDPSIWVASDRVFLPDRDEWYETGLSLQGLSFGDYPILGVSINGAPVTKDVAVSALDLLLSRRIS